jgi:integrase/recombinase XerD
MKFQNESLEALAKRGKVYLQRKNKSESTICKYLWIWQQIDKYLLKNDLQDCDKNAVISYLRNKFGDCEISKLTHHQRSCVTQALNLIQFKESGEMYDGFTYVQKEKPILKGDIGNLMQDFIILKKARRLVDKTLRNYKLYLYGFQKHMYSNQIFEIGQISPLAVLSFCETFSPNHLGAKHVSLCIVRNFLRYAYDNKRTKTDLSLVVPHDNYRRERKLPSLYSKKEVNKILTSINRSTATGKRNYAIILLIVRIGLRASDVRALSFDNVKWSENLISFEQCKTGKRVELPLPVDVGEAVIDYLKYGRPKANNVHIFLEHTYPYDNLRDKTVSTIATRAIRDSGINIGKRKHGSHALRHTMAGFLLEGKTPITLISDLLGHTDIQSTMCYLRVDIEKLRQCALDVPSVDIAFYEQKGGMFYV